MSSSKEITTGYLATVTPVFNHQLLIVPGMETYFSTYPVVVYESTNRLLDHLVSSATVHLPNLIVIDLSRSTDAGLNFLRDLKAHQRLQSIPVLVRRISTKSSRGIAIPVRSWNEITQPHSSERPLLIAA